MISQRSIQEVLEVAKVEDVIEDFVNLRPRGVNLIGLCPFHDEKTPSFTVSPTKNIYKCFGCGKGGNAVQFLMEHEQMSFPEAVRHLAVKYNIELEETQRTEEEIQDRQERESLLIINDFALSYFQRQLHEHAQGRAVGLSYFKERGFLESTIEQFQLGFATVEKDDLTMAAIEAGYNKDFLQNLGLTTQKEMDFFRHRVMFPIHNLSGKVIAFAGRSLSADKRSPKYINSPESDIYNKRKTLYGLHLAKSAVRKEDLCLLVEGYTDVITLFQSGIQNVVASSGTSLTEGQIRLIKRYTANMAIIYDGDAAGVKAAMRGLDLILSQDMNVRLVVLPESEDPDSYLKRVGASAFRDYVREEAKDFILFKTELLLGEVAGDPVKKSRALKDIISSIAKIPDTLKRSLYIQECSRRLEVDESVLVSETNKVIRSEIRQRKLREDRQVIRQEETYIAEKKKEDGSEYTIRTLSDDYQEKDIVRLLITHGDKMYDADTHTTVASYIIDNIKDVIEGFDHPLYLRVVRLVSDELGAGRPIQTSFFTTHPDAEIQQLAVTFLSSPYEYARWEERGYYLQSQEPPEKNVQKDSLQAILRFKLRKITKQLDLVIEKINGYDEAQRESEDYIVALHVHQQLVQARNDIAHRLKTIVLK